MNNGKTRELRELFFLLLSHIRITSSLDRQKQNITEFKQGKKMKGKLRKRGTPTTNEVENRIVTEVAEDMVCCWHYEKWLHEPCAGKHKNNSDTSAIFVHTKMFLFVV